jgi:hypothetical protein
MMRQLIVLAILSASATMAHAADLLKVGDAFPPWSLVDQTGKTVSSRELAGKKYLLWFYPKAMTPGCTAEGNGLRDRFADLQKAGVEVLGVSFDPPPDNARFVNTRDRCWCRRLTTATGGAAHLLPRRSRREGAACLWRGDAGDARRRGVARSERGQQSRPVT